MDIYHQLINNQINTIEKEAAQTFETASFCCSPDCSNCTHPARTIKIISTVYLLSKGISHENFSSDAGIDDFVVYPVWSLISGSGLNSR